MYIKKLKGYEAPQMLLENELFSERVLCASGIDSTGIGDYTEDDKTDYFN